MGADALDHVMLIEDEFGISIPDSDAADMWTVGEWERYLCSRCPDIEPAMIRERHRKILVRMSVISPSQAADIRPEHHLIHDLNFE